MAKSLPGIPAPVGVHAPRPSAGSRRRSRSRRRTRARRRAARSPSPCGSRSASPMAASISSGIGGTIVLSWLGPVERDGGDGPLGLVEERLELRRRRRHGAVESLDFRSQGGHPSRRPYRNLISMLARHSVGHRIRRPPRRGRRPRHPDLELVGALVLQRCQGRPRRRRHLRHRRTIGVAPQGSRRDCRPGRRLRALHAAGRDEPDRRARRHLRALAPARTWCRRRSTGLIYPTQPGRDVVERLESACANGRPSFHGTGIEPGWAAEVLPLTMSGSVPADRLAAGAGADGLHHLRQRRHDVRHHGLRQGARRPRADGRRRTRRRRRFARR